MINQEFKHIVAMASVQKVHFTWVLIVLAFFLVLALPKPVFSFEHNTNIGLNHSEISGITEAHKDVDLSMQVRGRITRIFFREGHRVKAGKIILHLDNRLEQLEVEQRRLILNNRVELRGAKEREKTLAKRLKATRHLFEENRSVSGELLEQKELEYLAAVIERKRLQAVEAQEKIEYDVAKINLERRLLRAPFDGVITRVLFDEGESVDINQPLVHLVDADSSYFVANLEERIGRQFQPGQKVDLAIQVGESKKNRAGVIVFVSPVVDPASGLMEVKARFDNQDGMFRPGVGGEIRIKTPDDPESAVREKLTATTPLKGHGSHFNNDHLLRKEDLEEDEMVFPIPAGQNDSSRLDVSLEGTSHDSRGTPPRTASKMRFLKDGMEVHGR